jgi:hypothetical protein
LRHSNECDFRLLKRILLIDYCLKLYSVVSTDRGTRSGPRQSATAHKLDEHYRPLASVERSQLHPPDRSSFKFGHSCAGLYRVGDTYWGNSRYWISRLPPPTLPLSWLVCDQRESSILHPSTACQTVAADIFIVPAREDNRGLWIAHRNMTGKPLHMCGVEKLVDTAGFELFRRYSFAFRVVLCLRRLNALVAFETQPTRVKFGHGHGLSLIRIEAQWIFLKYHCDAGRVSHRFVLCI